MFLQTTVSLKEVFRPDAEICGHLFEPSWSAEGLENRAAEQEGWVVNNSKLYTPASSQSQIISLHEKNTCKENVLQS